MKVKYHIKSGTLDTGTGSWKANRKPYKWARTINRESSATSDSDFPPQHEQEVLTQGDDPLNLTFVPEDGPEDMCTSDEAEITALSVGLGSDGGGNAVSGSNSAGVFRGRVDSDGNVQVMSYIHLIDSF